MRRRVGRGRHRGQVYFVAERIQRFAEKERATAESKHRVATDQFSTETRRAIREEVEIASEMQKSEDEQRRALAPAKRPRGR